MLALRLCIPIPKFITQMYLPDNTCAIQPFGDSVGVLFRTCVFLALLAHGNTQRIL